MCFGGGSSTPASPPATGVSHDGSPPSAAPAISTAGSIQSQADQNAANIKAGNSNIDKAFGQFNEPYYTGYQKAYTGYYNPQVDTQYKDANGTLEAGLARNGVDRSSIAATQMGRLFQNYADQKSTIGNQAVDASNQLRTKVASEKSNLYGLNTAAGDPAQANTQATAAATSLVAPQTFTPLGNLFASAIAPWTAYSNAYNNSGGGATYTSPYKAA